VAKLIPQLSVAILELTLGHNVDLWNVWLWNDVL